MTVMVTMFWGSDSVPLVELALVKLPSVTHQNSPLMNTLICGLMQNDIISAPGVWLWVTSYI